MAALDFRGGAPFMPPHRKPVPVAGAGPHNPPSAIHPDIQYVHDVQPRALRTSTTTTTTMSTSSSANPHLAAAFPPRISSTVSPSRTSPNSNAYVTSQSAIYKSPMFTSRRTASQSTTSSNYNNTATFTSMPSRMPSNVSSKISRTSSTRSGHSLNSSPGSYVALMRKQRPQYGAIAPNTKIHVSWRSKKAAKIRATREIEGIASGEGRTSTSGGSLGSSGVRSKIRHHGVPKASAMHGGGKIHMLGQAGLPMRLSANEVGDEDDEGRDARSGQERTSTGRDSMGRHTNTFLSVDANSADFSSGNRRYSSERRSHEDIPELAETNQPPQHLSLTNSDDLRTMGSRGSSERENSFGAIGNMSGPPVKTIERRTSEELRRRGSVDERANTMTMGFMGGGRLFVANPDLSD